MAGYKRFKCFRETFLKRPAEHQRCKSWNVKRRALDKHKGRMKLSTGTRKATHEKPMKSASHAAYFCSFIFFALSDSILSDSNFSFHSENPQSVSVLSLLLPGGRTRGCLRGASIVGSGKSIANDFEKTDPLVQGWQDDPRTGIVFHSQQRDWSMNVSRIFWLSFQSFLTWDSKDFQVSESGFTQITQVHLDLYATPMALLPIFVSSLHPISASRISSFLPTWHLFSAGSWSSRSYTRNVRRRRGEQYWCCELNALNALRTRLSSQVLSRFPYRRLLKKFTFPASSFQAKNRRTRLAPIWVNIWIERDSRCHSPPSKDTWTKWRRHRRHLICICIYLHH